MESVLPFLLHVDTMVLALICIVGAVAFAAGPCAFLRNGALRLILSPALFLSGFWLLGVVFVHH